jgi:signal transduction histidine kinase
MATRPLDRLTSIRAKLGAVIVFAVAVTILIMYIAVGFTLRRFEHDREFNKVLGEATGVAALGFNDAGRPSIALERAISQLGGPVVVVDAFGDSLIARHRPVPATVHRALTGHLDTGEIGTSEYIGVPVIREGTVVGAVYLAYRVEGGGLTGAVRGTANFVTTVWWQFLLAGLSAAIIALALARFLARGLTQPLRDMAEAASGMARGDYGHRVEVASRDEVGRLAVAFNRMAGEMEGLERLRRDLVANVSHELKTPIAALRAHLENLLDGVEEPRRETLQVMLEQSERLTRLVEEVLDLSRLESGGVTLTMEPVALAPLVRQVGREIQIGRGEGVVFRNEVPEDLPPVSADGERLHQVLFNLLDNAFRFTPAGGFVTVSASRVNGSCEVTVDDTGPGIPEEHLPFVFERFYRVDSARSRGDGGTGIGLTIVRSVVEAHGGHIWAERREEGGSRFRFELPFDGPEPAEERTDRTDRITRPTPPAPRRAPDRTPVAMEAS